MERKKINQDLECLVPLRQVFCNSGIALHLRSRVRHISSAKPAEMLLRNSPPLQSSNAEGARCDPMSCRGKALDTTSPEARGWPP